MDGHFSIPTRLRLSPAQRDQLAWLIRERGLDLEDLVSELVAAFLAGQPAPPASPAHDAQQTIHEQLRIRRGQLRSLRGQLHDPHNPPPAWLRAMIAELEAEVAQLELAIRSEG